MRRKTEKKEVSRSKVSTGKRSPAKASRVTRTRSSRLPSRVPSESPRAGSPLQVPPQVITRMEEILPSDLPFSYGETKLVLLVRDPYWGYSYWDFSGETWNWVQGKLREDSSLKPILRVHDLDAKRSYDLLVSLEAKNWYVHLGTPDHRYVAELGIGDGNSKFYLIARSNEVRTPRDTPSDVIDPNWSDRDFDEIYRLSGGGQAGLSSPGSIFFPRKT